MKVVFFECEEWEEEHLRNFLKGIRGELVFLKEKLTMENVENFLDASAISVFIYSEVSSRVLSKMKNLKMISTRSAGFDHIDMKFCSKKKIIVCNAPSYAEQTVAEHTFALLLVLSRKVSQGVERTRKAIFDSEGLGGFDLSEKVIGIIGLGRIGQRVAKIAQGFNMNVLAFDRHNKMKGVKIVDLNYLLKNSDVISLHVPYTKENHHLINKKNIKFVKKGAILINTARGGIVDSRALLIALQTGIISGAGLDVLEEEPLIKEENQFLSKNFNKKELSSILENHLLLKNPNVIITPHSAFYSNESILRLIKASADNVRSFLEGKIINQVRVKR